ncbi:MAG: protealysin inhibitor emfourin [Spirochaetia bacterium]|nr:protealysin inhibitor emfourin [Spirochaetia bacterium]
MRIQFETLGGFAYFPGLQRPIRIDTERLTTLQAGELESMIRAAHFFDQSDSIRPAGAADYRSYRITVEDGEKSHTVRVVESTADRPLLDLLAYLRTLGAESLS